MNIRHGIPKEMRIEAITWAFEYFKYVTPKDYFFAILQQETNWGISAILLDEEDKIMGL